MSAWRERSKDSSIPTDHIVTQGVESANRERERVDCVCERERKRESELTCVCGDELRWDILKIMRLEREEQRQLHTHGPYCYPGCRVSEQRERKS